MRQQSAVGYLLTGLGISLLLLVTCASPTGTDVQNVTATTTWTRTALAPARVSSAPTQSSSAVPGPTRTTAANRPNVEEPGTRTPKPIPSSTGTPVPNLRDEWVSTFGVQMRAIPSGPALERAAEAGVYWIRCGDLLWAAVEPTPGARAWEAMADLETELLAARAAGMQVILVVRKTPDWAQKVPGHSCGPVAPEALDDMGRFLADAVKRYGAPPFDVKYWELGNEPDVDPSLVKPHSGFGCWGDADDPYYGGEYYARMLRTVYPAIKATDPEAQVLIGGLLLDKEPAMDDLPNPPGRFLEGILQGGGGDFFDVVSFHAYALYDGKLHDWELLNPAWVERGGVVAGKVSFLRQVLAAYGYNKPIMLTEAGLLCAGCSSPPPGGFLAAQAAYVPRLYTRNIALGLTTTVWFTLDGPGWREAGLLGRDQTPRPAYRALQTMTRLLDDAEYVGPIEVDAGLTGYAFQRSDRQVWVLWSSTGAPVQIPVPPGILASYDALGSRVPSSTRQIVVGVSPVYLEISPP